MPTFWMDSLVILHLDALLTLIEYCLLLQLPAAGKKSLSMLRLLVPDVHDSASMQSPSFMKDPEQFVSIAGFDLAGVPVNPFSASLLPGKPSYSTGQRLDNDQHDKQVQMR